MSDDLPTAGRFDGRDHLLPVRVYYEDTDFTGLVYHANYVRYFERGRSDFLRAIGVGSPQRVSVLPEVRTIAEQGFKGFDAVSWGGLLAPPGTPKEVVDRVAREVKAILADKVVQDKLLNAGAIAHFQNPAQLGQRVQQDYTRWGQLIRDKGIASE